MSNYKITKTFEDRQNESADIIENIQIEYH